MPSETGNPVSIKVRNIYNRYLILYILLYSRTKEEHLKLLEKFIHIIEISGISLSKKKAEIMKNQIEFLGIQIDKNGIKMQTHIIQKICNSE